MLSRHSFRHRFAAWLVDGQGALGNGFVLARVGFVMARGLGNGLVMAKEGLIMAW